VASESVVSWDARQRPLPARVWRPDRRPFVGRYDSKYACLVVMLRVATAVMAESPEEGKPDNPMHCVVEKEN
jgi:hypothetical protein